MIRNVQAPYHILEDAVTLALVFPDLWHRPVCQFLEVLVTHSEPTLPRHQVEETLRQATGTLIEPLSLTETDYELAGWLATLAFSRGVGESRFRIVSRDTLGDRGGLVLLCSGKSYFASRLEGGRHRPQRTFSGGLLAPALAQQLLTETRASAQIRPHETDGLQLLVYWPKNQNVCAGLWLDIPVQWVDISKNRYGTSRQSVGSSLSRFQQHSNILGSARQTFDQLGFRLAENQELHEKDPGMVLTAGSSEVMLRLIALCSQNAVFRFAMEPEGGENGRYSSDLVALFVRSALPEEESVELQTLRVKQSANRSYWVRLPRLREKISRGLSLRGWSDALLCVPNLESARFTLPYPAEREPPAVR